MKRLKTNKLRFKKSAWIIWNNIVYLYSINNDYKLFDEFGRTTTPQTKLSTLSFSSNDFIIKHHYLNK
jgi:hypothetical protein